MEGFTYQITAEDFDLRPGDRVWPGLEIGTDIISRAAIYVDYNGVVAAIHHNTMNESFMVLIFKQDNGEVRALRNTLSKFLS
jgi:hypothetical protein